MPGDRALPLGRLGRVIGWLDAAPAPLDDAALAQAVRLATRLWGHLFTAETGLDPAPARPPAAEAPAVFAPCPDPCDAAPFQAWYAAQGGLFLHYAPVAARLLGPASLQGERTGALLLPDALRLLGAHAAGLGRPPGRFEAGLTPAAPFARLVQRTRAPRSSHSSDVNLGAVALGLALESGMRHALGLPDAARLSMWRLFRALNEAAAEVRLTVGLPVLIAVYNWAGRHRHAGRRDYGWLNYYAADLLHPLFVPPWPLGFGLDAAPATLARLRDAASGNDHAPDPAAHAPSPGDVTPPRIALVAAA